MFDATTNRADCAAATTVTASAVATNAAAVARESCRATRLAVMAPSPAQEAAAAAPPSAGRRGVLHYRGQWRQPNRDKPPPGLPPLPRLLTTAHDAATAGSAPPRAHRVRLRVDATPPPLPVCVTRQPAGFGSHRRRPHRPPALPSTQPLFFIAVVQPTTDPLAQVAWRWWSVGPAAVRSQTHWRRRVAPPLPTESASWVQVAARQPLWPHPPSPRFSTSRVPHAVALAGAAPPVFRRGGVPPLPPPRRLLSSPTRAAGGPHPLPPRYAPPCALGRAPPARPRGPPPPRRARGRRASAFSGPPPPRRGARRAPPWHPTRTAVVPPTHGRSASPPAAVHRPTHATQPPSPLRRHP